MNLKEVKTSVIIPIYNTEKYLKHCIDSVLNQTQKEIEIILVDDGSTDGSTDIIREYEKKYSYVKAVYQENKKQGAARNTGIEMASGKYIYFLDSDDFIRENLLSECYRQAEKKQLDFVIFDAKTFLDAEISDFRKNSTKEVYDRGGLQIGDNIYSGIEFWNNFYLKGGIFFSACLVYVKTKFIKDNQLIFEPGVYYEDNDWIVRMFYYAKRICYIPQQFYLRRFRTGSSMTSYYNELHLKSTIVLCRKMMDMFFDMKIKSMKNMVAPVLEKMLWRFKETLKFCNKYRLISNDNLNLILDFYKELVYACKNNYLTIQKIQYIIISSAEAIQLEMQKVPDLELEEYKTEIFTDGCRGYDLFDKNKSIGIYGTGLACERFMYIYQKYVAKISANLFFIDTFAKTGDKYQGYQVYNVEDIGEKKVDCIIIASTRYKEIMKKKIQELFPQLYERIEVLYIPDVVKYFL